MRLTNKNSGKIMFDMIRTIQQNKDYLSEIDGAIGDGDHGINMNKGFTLAEKKLINANGFTLSEGLQTLGEVLIMEIGGSMGPLYGTLFMKMGESCEGLDEINANDLNRMLTEAYEGLREIVQADVGDKTLMDVLILAKDSFSKAVNSGKSFIESLEDLKEAAYQGWQFTKNIVAKFGRASRLGERSRGILDAGATSCYLLLSCIVDGMSELLKTEEVD